MGDPTNTTTNPPSTDGMIRNINQTVQEREIIRTAPDLIVYLDGKTYLLNPYITNTEQNQPYTFVSFNDYVQNFSSSYDTDNLVPSANFTLEVPNFSKHLFQAPGGNNLIESMMEVQVFAKGYYPSGNGNTVYHRVFKGTTSHVAHTDNGMFLEISVQCLGILNLLEYMYVDLNPSAKDNSERTMTAMGTNQFNMNPYQQLADTFLRGITFEGFQLNSIVQDKINGSYWEDAVKHGYCEKWQPILNNIRKEVHITGYKPGSVWPSDVNGFTEPLPDAEGSNDPTLAAARHSHRPKLAQNVTDPDFFVDVIRGYYPDMSVAGQLQLTNSRVVSRLEHIRAIAQYIGFEGFQDIDGTIIFKPPLYNLDVRNIGSSTPVNTQSNKPQTSVDITDFSNPFIVHLSEIETESESEDQQAIRATRVTIQPSWIGSNQYIQDGATQLVRPAITHIDIPKMAKFGLREEPARTIKWLGVADKVACYTYAVCELNRINRGWRTYNITIPLRPELKLGFPMYFPHKDMFGYIKSISISYSYGGAATMNIMLDSVRKRPVFPQVKSGGANPPIVYTTQPNLVMEWTEPPNTSTNNPNFTQTSGVITQPSGVSSMPSNQPAVTVDGFPTANSIANLVGAPASQLKSPERPIYEEDMEVISARRSQYGTSWSTRADTRSKSFRVQNDKAVADDSKLFNGNGQNIKAGEPFFSATNWYNPPSGENNNSRNKGVNMSYLQKIVSSQPYTDEGGYELLTPFPWGRWKTLKEAIYETHEGVLVDNPTSDEAQVLGGAKAFVFAGVGSVGSSTDPSSTLETQLKTISSISNLVANATTFEIEEPKPGEQQPNILNNQQPDSLLVTTVAKNTIADAVNLFLTGSTPPQQGSALSLALNFTDDTNTNQA